MDLRASVPSDPHHTYAVPAHDLLKARLFLWSLAPHRRIDPKSSLGKPLNGDQTEAIAEINRIFSVYKCSLSTHFPAIEEHISSRGYVLSLNRRDGLTAKAKSAMPPLEDEEEPLLRGTDGIYAMSGFMTRIESSLVRKWTSLYEKRQA